MKKEGNTVKVGMWEIDEEGSDPTAWLDEEVKKRAGEMLSVVAGTEIGYENPNPKIS